MDLSPEAERNFWELTSRSSDKDGCWDWVGPDNGNGYGMYNLNGRSVGAHRIAWCLEHKQTLPSYHQVRRTCKNRSCVRPSHLRRIRRVYAKSVGGKKNKPYTVIRPPSATPDGTQNISDPPVPKSPPPKGPRVERYMKETKEVKTILTAVVAGFSQVSEMLYAHKQGLENLHLRLTKSEKLEAERARSQSMRLDEAVAALVSAEKRIAEIPISSPPPPVATIAAEPPSPAATATKSPDATVPTPPKSGNGVKRGIPEDTSLAGLLAKMYAAAVGARPSDQESEKLVVLFSHAEAESQVSRRSSTPRTASAVFARWLEQFESELRSEPELARSVNEFERMITAMLLPPPLN